MESSLAGGTLTVPDIAKIGRQTLLEAQTNEGFLFLGWFDQNNNLLSSAHSTYLTFSQDSSIIGKFQQKSAQVTIKVKDPQTGVFRVGPALQVMMSLKFLSLMETRSGLPHSLLAIHLFKMDHPWHRSKNFWRGGTGT